jgi:hypothetical protein
MAKNDQIYLGYLIDNIKWGVERKRVIDHRGYRRSLSYTEQRNNRCSLARLVKYTSKNKLLFYIFLNE